MYNVYEYYSSAMFVYCTSLAYCSRVFIWFPSSLPSLYHPPPFLPSCSLAFPLTFFPSFPSCPLLFLPSFPFYPYFSYPSISTKLSISYYLLFPNSFPSFLSIPPFLARLLPVQPLIFFPILPLI